MHTIYGGTTVNNIMIDDMVDNNRDYVYQLTDYPGYFTRLSGALVGAEKNEGQGPNAFALAMFHEDAPFMPLYGKVLEMYEGADTEKYFNKYGRETENVLAMAEKFHDEAIEYGMDKIGAFKDEQLSRESQNVSKGNGEER